MAQLPLGRVLLVWTAPPLQLNSAPWKNNVLGGIFKPSTNRQSFVAFKPASSFPAVTQLLTGELYLFIVTTAFDLPGAELTAPTGGSGENAPDTFQLSGSASDTVTQGRETIVLGRAATLTASFGAGSGTAQYSTNEGTSWSNVGAGASLPSGATLDLRALHSAAFALTFTLTYSS